MCQNRGHGTHLVRADLRPPSRSRRGRRGRPATSRWSGRPGAASPATSSRSATRTTRRSPQGEGQAVARRRRRSCRRASTRRSSSTARASTRSRRSSSPASGPTATTRAAPRRGKQVAFVVELDGAPHDPPRRHRPPPDRGEARRHRDRSTSPACRSAGSLTPREGRRARRPARPADRRADADLRRRGRLRRGARASSSTRWAPSRRPSRSCRCRCRACRARRRRSCSSRAASRPDRIARQARSRTTRPRLITVRTRSAAGQYGICVDGRHAPDDEVGGLARLDRADLVLEAERAGRVDRHRASSDLVGRHAAARGRPTVITSGRLAVGDVPGLKSVPSATGTPRSMNVRAGASWSFIRNQVVAGRSGRDDRPVRAAAAAASASMPASRRRREVVGRGRPELGRELRAARRRQLVGVQPRAPCRSAAAASRIRRDWSAVKTPVLAEDVAEPRPAVRGDPRQLVLDDRADVRLGAVRAASGTRAGRRARRGTSGRRRSAPRGRAGRRPRAAGSRSRGPGRSRTSPRSS